MPTRRQALEEAHRLLSQTYGQRWTTTQMKALQEQIAHITPEHIVEAVQRHISNTDDDDFGKPRGTWAPKPAEVLAQVKAIETETRRTNGHQADEARRQQFEEWEAQAQEDQYKEIPLKGMDEPSKRFWRTFTKGGRGANPTPIHIRDDVLRIPQHRVASYTCSFCLDTGWDWFYFEPDQRRRVWLREEAARLPETSRNRLQTHRAICDRCTKGALQKIALKHIILETKQVTLMAKIRKLADARRIRDATTVGMG